MSLINKTQVKKGTRVLVKRNGKIKEAIVVDAMRDCLMEKDINYLQSLADKKCGSDIYDNHDFENCDFCIARRILNEISEIAHNGVNEVVKLKKGR